MYDTKSCATLYAEGHYFMDSDTLHVAHYMFLVCAISSVHAFSMWEGIVKIDEIILRNDNRLQ
jgi:hypothetical protein